MSNPRLLVNRACIYERQLPGDAYITAHVQRLQHGYYSSPAVPDTAAEHVDFLAVSFVFHASNTLLHRFKSATIRAGIHGISETSKSAPSPNGPAPASPRFLMHAPHLIYGTMSPETMEWTFSLAGSLGISETPVSANVIPSGSVNGRYQRYEMMRIQGSVRTLKSPRSPEFNVEAGEIVWSLEENNLQQSGLPREFTFVMLIQKPTANSKIKLSLNIEPVIQAWCGSYPSWMLALSAYRPVQQRGVDFCREIGQCFEPTDAECGFNFAALESSFDDYIAMPGRKYTRSIHLPPGNELPPTGSLQQSYPGQYGALNPVQPLQGNNPGNTLLQSQLRELYTPPSDGNESVLVPAAANTAIVGPMATPLRSAESQSHTLNIRFGLDQAVLSALRVRSPPAATTRVRSPNGPWPERSPDPPYREVYVARTASLVGSTTRVPTSSSGTTAANPFGYDEGTFDNPSWPPMSDVGPGFRSYENVRASMLRSVHLGTREEESAVPGDEPTVMNMANCPLNPGLLATLSEREK